jgi:predicted MFS family arabinose efflux permease
MGWLVGIGLGGYLAAAHGWRATFLVAGVPGVVLAVITWLVLDEPRARLGAPFDSSRAEGVREALMQLRNKRSYLLALAGICTYAVFTYGLSTFLPSFMIRSLHASMEQISLPWGVAISIANLMGALIGGQLADRLSRSDIRWYAWIPAIACALDVPAYGFALMSNHVKAFIPLDFLAEIIISAGMSPIFVAMHAVCGSRRRTIAIATALLLFSLLGSGVGPPLVGLISDALLPRYGAESLRYSLFAVVLFLLPAAVIFCRTGFAMPPELEE